MGLGSVATTLHSLALAQAVQAEDVTLAGAWIQVCHELVEMGEPIQSSVGKGASVQLFGFYWPSDPRRVMMTRSLAEFYLGHGLASLDDPIPGDISCRFETLDDDGFCWDGLAPMAAAISCGNVESVRFLLEKGASKQLGQVFLDRPPYEAFDLARDMGQGAVLAVLTEALMTDRLDELLTPADESLANAEVQPARRRGARL
ncbi:hypothetical protein [Paucibacter soli]|uniref:hypothetical protein n=1 Tax=Paucibacter soli TaxID=3133433 RepID=UPI00309E552D